ESVKAAFPGFGLIHGKRKIERSSHIFQKVVYRKFSLVLRHYVRGYEIRHESSGPSRKNVAAKNKRDMPCLTDEDARQMVKRILVGNLVTSTRIRQNIRARPNFSNS